MEWTSSVLFIKQVDFLDPLVVDKEHGLLLLFFSMIKNMEFAIDQPNIDQTKVKQAAHQRMREQMYCQSIKSRHSDSTEQTIFY